MALTINKCFCISLPTACIIVGFLGGIFSLIKSIECFEHLYYLYGIESNNTVQYDSSRNEIYYVLVPNMVYVITSILLIVGVRKNSHLMLLPWLIFNVIVLLLFIPVVLFFFYYANLKLTTRNIFKFVAIISLVFGVSCWIWSSVYTLFQDIRKWRNEQLSRNEKNLRNLYPCYEIVQLNI